MFKILCVNEIPQGAEALDPENAPPLEPPPLVDQPELPTLVLTTPVEALIELAFEVVMVALTKGPFVAPAVAP
jgi:hypothetical protein